MDAFTAGYLANLASALTGYMIDRAKAKLRRQLKGTEAEQALERSLQAGLVALLATASARSPDQAHHLSGIFERFFQDEQIGEEVGEELALLLAGQPLDLAALGRLFEQAGYDAKSLAYLNFDFEQGMLAFRGAFLLAAIQEPLLQPMIQAGNQVIQTGLQYEIVDINRQMLDTLGEMVALLRQHRAAEIDIQAGNLITHDSQIIFQWPSLGPGPPPATDLRRRYLAEVSRETNRLPWSSVEREYANPEGGEALGLAEVYTALDTTELERIDQEAELRRFMLRLEREETRRIPAQTMANQQQRLLILGDPGSGKSTFVNYLAYSLAQAGLASEAETWLERLAPWEHGPLLPIRVELRAMAAELEAGLRGQASLILSHLRRTLAEWQLEDCWPLLDEALRSQEQALLLLFDGLDEVPTELRQTVVQATQDFAGRYPQHRYLVTCRPYAYVGQPWPLRGFSEVTLAPFNEAQIDQFIETWYRELARLGRLTPAEAGDKTGKLQQATRKPDLGGLARRPLLLTVMTLLHTFRGQLPEDRTELYADAVDLLLHRWQQRTGGGAGLLEQLNVPGLKMSDLQAGLYAVAFQAHSQAEVESDHTADIDEADLRKWLAPYLGGDWNKAGDFIAYIRERAGLLVRHKTEAYTFPHRTFQEFMAACHLVTMTDYPGQAARLVRQAADRWREVFILAAGYAARSHRLGQAIAAVNALCPGTVAETRPEAAAFRRATLAGEALLEIGLVGVRREEAGQALLRRLQQWLGAAMRADQLLEPRERAAAGDVLARLGDPRPGVGLRSDGLPDIAWRDIPASPFLMGSDPRQDRQAKKDEQPQHEVTLPAYRISRYPITNAQYQAFVDDGVYGQAAYWPEAAAAGYWLAGGKFKGRYDDEARDRPYDYGSPFTVDNHPVVGVSWYEAVAFCRWLTERLRTAGQLSPAEMVCLPTETEWEKAARGTDGRLYPWSGNQGDPNRANYDEIGLGTTSAVGCFPGGASPYGVEEMSGNVWEWCATQVGKPYPYQLEDEWVDAHLNADSPRALRGGSFDDNGVNVRCAVRDRSNPGNRNFVDGFRVVLVGAASSSL